MIEGGQAAQQEFKKGRTNIVMFVGLQGEGTLPMGMGVIRATLNQGPAADLVALMCRAGAVPCLHLVLDCVQHLPVHTAHAGCSPMFPSHTPRIAPRCWKDDHMHKVCILLQAQGLQARHGLRGHLPSWSFRPTEAERHKSAGDRPLKMQGGGRGGRSGMWTDVGACAAASPSRCAWQVWVCHAGLVSDGPLKSRRVMPACARKVRQPCTLSRPRRLQIPFYGSYTETDPAVIAQQGVERFKQEKR